MTLLPWGLFRRPDGRLEVAFRAFVDDDGYRLLGGYAKRPEAVEARDEQARRDELEALRERGQRDLFREED